MSIEIQFLGGAGTVTGSKYLLTFNSKKILIDCGLFQGLKSLRLKNWEAFPINPSEIDAVILTHAHIDHSGYIPRLVKDGFRGRVYSTHATKELCGILLPDSGHLMEEEADYLNRKHRSKHIPALPLFTTDDAENSLNRFTGVDFDTKVDLGEGASFEFRYAGHILGAASAIFEAGGRKVAFTGDIGRLNDDLLYPPAPLPKVDYLITESTYGNRKHKPTNVVSDLEEIINEGYKRGAVIIVPSFAVGRTQSLMHHLWLLRKQGRIPEFPMYLNSPMATNVSGLMMKYTEFLKISAEECRDLCSIVEYVRSVEHSKALNKKNGPMLIISASGMLTGGRVLHHLKAFAPHENNIIVMAGFQAAGTRGEALEHGAEEVKIHGSYVSVKAKVKSLDNISAHADYVEMIQWFKESAISPKQVFVTHGEPSAADTFRRRLTESFGWNCTVPSYGDKVLLD